MEKTVIKIDGMMCSMCETHINEAIRKNFPGCKVKSNRRKKESVILSREALDRDAVKKVIEATGYTFLGIE